MSDGVLTPKTRVLIVDDHQAVREALALRINRQDDLEVCGEAADEAQALRLLAETDPDVIIVDLSLKSSSGLDLMRKIIQTRPGSRMIAWSMHSEPLYAERAAKAGALAYINKDQASETITEAIRAARDGRNGDGPLGPPPN